MITSFIEDDYIPDEAKLELLNEIVLFQETLQKAEKSLGSILKTYQGYDTYGDLAKSIRSFRHVALAKIERVNRATTNLLPEISFERDYPLPFLTRDLESIDQAVFDQYIQDIRTEIGGGKSVDVEMSPFLKAADNRFKESIEIVKKRAQKLHGTFQETCKGEPPVSLDPETGNVVATMEQIDRAVTMLKENFPHNLQGAFTAEQRALVSEALQLLMTGECTEGLKSEFILVPQELERYGRGESVLVNTEEKSAVKEFFDQVLPRISGDFSEEARKIRIGAVCHQYRFDSIDRIGRLVHEDENGQIVTSVFGGNDHVFSLSRWITDKYKAYLMEHPENLAEVIEVNRRSDLFSVVVGKEGMQGAWLTEELFIDFLGDEILSCLPDQNPELFDLVKGPLMGGKTSEEIVLQIKDMFPNWLGENQIHLNEILSLVTNTRLSGEEVEFLMEKGYEYKDVEPLLRIKMFESMVLFNQSISAVPSVSVFGNLGKIDFMKYPDIHIRPGGSGQASYQFSEDFQGLKFTQGFSFGFLTEQFEGDLHYDVFGKDLSEGIYLKSTISIPSMSAFGEDVEPVVMRNYEELRFSWNIANETLQCMNEKLFPEKPIDKVLDKLSPLLREEVGFDVTKEGFVPTKKTWVSAAHKGLTHKAEEEFRELLAQTVEEVQSYHDNFLGVPENFEEKRKEVFELLVGLQERVPLLFGRNEARQKEMENLVNSTIGSISMIV